MNVLGCQENHHTFLHKIIRPNFPDDLGILQWLTVNLYVTTHIFSWVFRHGHRGGLSPATPNPDRQQRYGHRPGALGLTSPSLPPSSHVLGEGAVANFHHQERVPRAESDGLAHDDWVSDSAWLQKWARGGNAPSTSSQRSLPLGKPLSRPILPSTASQCLD